MIDDSFLTGSKIVMDGGVTCSDDFSILFREEMDIKKLDNGIEIEKTSNNSPIIHISPRSPITNYHNVLRYGRFG